MVKAHPIIKYAVATLVGVCALMAVVWAHNRLAPSPAPAETDPARAVKLRFTFADGHRADVTEVEGGTIKIEKDGRRSPSPHAYATGAAARSSCGCLRLPGVKAGRRWRRRAACWSTAA